MRRMSWGLVLAVLVSSSGWAKGFKEGDALGPDEGILVTTMTCGRPVAGVQLFQSGKSSGGFWGPLKSDASIGCTKDLQLVRLKAGSYYIGQLFSGAHNRAVAEDKSPRFTIEAGKLNYVGDVYAGDVLMDVDEQTLVHVAGRLLTVLNHEPQARESLAQAHAAVLARYPWIANAGLPPPVTFGPKPEVAPGQMQGVITLSASRWKRGDNGQPLICPRYVPLPKGTKRAPGEAPVCAEEYVTAEAFVQAEQPGATLGRAEPQGGDDGPLVITFVGVPPDKTDAN